LVSDLAVIVGRNAAHIVVDGRQDRDRLLGHVDAGEDLGAFGDARQALVQDLRIQVVQVQEDVVLVRTDAAAFADFDGHGAADHVARGQILGGRRIALHEALAFGIGQIAALAARALGDQAAGAIDAGRVELDELHVLQRQAGAQHHGVAVAGAGVGAGGAEIGAAIAAGGQHDHLGAERCSVPLSSCQAMTPRQAPSSMIRSSAKYSTKNFGLCFSDWPYSVCRMAWPVRSAAAQVRCTGPFAELRVMPPKAR
jgi:hypothetical protein